MTWSVSVLCPVREGVGLRPLAGRIREDASPVRDGWRSAARCSRSTTGPAPGGSGEGVHVRVLKGLRLVELVILVTISVVRDTPPDCHFSAWSRPKPAPDPLPGPSVASGVIPTKGGRNGVLQPPAGRAPQGRWRSSPWKRCNHAPPRSRVREHPAPLGALRHHRESRERHQDVRVREHPAPLGALRPRHRDPSRILHTGQGAPRTARCIKTLRSPPFTPLRGQVREHPAPLGALRHDPHPRRQARPQQSGTVPHRYGVSGVRLVCGGGGPWLLVAWTRVVLCTPLGGLPLVCWPGFVRVSQSEDQSRPTPPGTLYTQCLRRSGTWTLTRPRGALVLILRLRQNRPPATAGAVHTPPSSPQGRSRTRWRGGAGRRSRGGDLAQVPDWAQGCTYRSWPARGGLAQVPDRAATRLTTRPRGVFGRASTGPGVRVRASGPRLVGPGQLRPCLPLFAL